MKDIHYPSFGIILLVLTAFLIYGCSSNHTHQDSVQPTKSLGNTPIEQATTLIDLNLQGQNRLLSSLGAFGFAKDSLGGDEPVVVYTFNCDAKKVEQQDFLGETHNTLSVVNTKKGSVAVSLLHGLNNVMRPEFEFFNVDIGSQIIDMLKAKGFELKRSVRPEPGLVNNILFKDDDKGTAVTAYVSAYANPLSTTVFLDVRSYELLSQKKVTDNSPIYEEADIMPSFPGGGEAIEKYLNDNIKYPKVARKNGVQGRVEVSFVVERDGTLSNIRVARSVDPLLDKEAKRVILAMPRWKPGKKDGKEVRVRYKLPVTFSLIEK